jgi:hypothetical protein
MTSPVKAKAVFTMAKVGVILPATITYNNNTTGLYIGLWVTHLYLPWPPWTA